MIKKRKGLTLRHPRVDLIYNKRFGKIKVEIEKYKYRLPIHFLVRFSQINNKIWYGAIEIAKYRLYISYFARRGEWKARYE